jgi:hypothetical protein
LRIIAHENYDNNLESSCIFEGKLPGLMQAYHHIIFPGGTEENKEETQQRTVGVRLGFEKCIFQI